jgi:hypothetical protein
MSTVNFAELIERNVEGRAVVWLRNPTDALLPLSIEPWGSVVYLLPKRDYAVVTEAEEDEPPSTATIEFASTLTLHPEGTKRNRIYRADGNLVWDDANPSELAPHLNERIYKAALHSARRDLGQPPDEVRAAMEQSLGCSLDRADVPLLLVEHGVLGLDHDGNITNPMPKQELN